MAYDPDHPPMLRIDALHTRHGYRVGLYEWNTPGGYLRWGPELRPSRTILGARLQARWLLRAWRQASKPDRGFERRDELARRATDQLAAKVKP